MTSSRIRTEKIQDEHRVTCNANKERHAQKAKGKTCIRQSIFFK